MTEQERNTRINQLMDALRLTENVQVTGSSPTMYQNTPTFSEPDRAELKAKLKSLLLESPTPTA